MEQLPFYGDNLIGKLFSKSDVLLTRYFEKPKFLIYIIVIRTKGVVLKNKFVLLISSKRRNVV